MAKVVNKNQNASALVNDVAFRLQNGFMVSIDHVDEENLEIFRRIPGFHVLEEAQTGDQQKAIAPVVDAPVVQLPAGAAADASEQSDGTAAAENTAPGSDAAADAGTKPVASKPAVHKPAAKTTVKKK